MNRWRWRGYEWLAPALATALLATPAAGQTDWENPVFDEAGDAVRAALDALAETSPGESSPREMFTLFVVSSAERPGDPRFDAVRRTVDSFLVTFPADLEDFAAMRTLDSFLDEVADEKAKIRRTLGRFGFPPLQGLTYLKLVGNVESLQGAQAPASEPGPQTQGVTYFCRYVVLPLSYVTAGNLERLRSSTLDPGVDVNTTLRAWERESFKTMLRTFRHEMVHVWTNSTLAPPRYSDRQRYPRWFLEGSASFLAADPHAGLSERYQDYQNLFFYLAERHGVAALQAFFGRILGGASVVESLEATYAIAGRGDLRQRQGRWHAAKDTVRALLAISLLLIVLAALGWRRLPVFGSLQLWLAVTLGYATFSGFCDVTQALNGATAVRIQQAILGAGALLFAVRGLRSVRRARSVA